MTDLPLYTASSQAYRVPTIIRNACEFAKAVDSVVKVDLNGTGYASLIVYQNAVEGGEINWNRVDRLDKSDKLLVDVREVIVEDLQQSLARGGSITMREEMEFAHVDNGHDA